MKDKTVLITGATSGIGRVTAIELTKKGANVVFIARNEEKSKKLISDTKLMMPDAKIDYIIADMVSLKQVREAADKFKSKYARLDVLINNAGGYFNPRSVTADGFETTFGVNYLSHFLLTGLLLDLLKKSAPSRIVNVSSMAYMMGHIDFNDLMSEKKYHGMKVYAQSKLANLIFSNTLAEKLQGTGVTSNALHPGVVNTNFSKDSTGQTGKFFTLFGFLFKTPEKGARTSIYLASSPEVNNITGKFFINCKSAKTRLKETRDPEVARKLWEISEKLVSSN
jgi:NAD(P)-dependent dehydrogenase (short-subunit alcohol dehydrogenase family)